MIIYYKSQKIKYLITKNDISASVPPKEQKSHLIYKFQCQERECISRDICYIGMTSCTLKERMTAHKYKGSIFKHYRLAHQKNPEISDLLMSTSILYQPQNIKQLAVFEAIYIREMRPKLNENVSDFSCLSLDIFWIYSLYLWYEKLRV